jgi:hypothetical protein
MTQRQHQSHTVYFRENWADDWEEQEHVFCDFFTQVAGPDVSEAVLRFNYGFVQPEGEQHYAQRARKEVNGQYVRIELGQGEDDDGEDTFKYWYGLIVETTIERDGRVTSQGTEAESGKQIFQCRGLEFLLQRKWIYSSFVFDSSEAEVEIGRAIAFNLGPGRDTDHARHGNRSEDKGNEEAYVFAADIGPPTASNFDAFWTVQQIIEYLFYYHPPGDIDGNDQLEWQVADGADAEILGKLYPTCHAQGKSIKQLLDELIDRRRLVGYTIDVVGDDENPKLNIFTFNKDSITLPGGTTIPPNGTQTTWYFDDDPSIRAAVVAEDDATRFDVVICRGDPLGGCFTTCRNQSPPYAYVLNDWDDTREDGYNTGASSGGTYAALIRIDKQAANQAYRADAIFEKVFRAFIIDPEWDGMLGAHAACPDPTTEDAEGDPSSTPSPFWYPGLKLLDRLPLRTDYDYTTVDDFETTSLTIGSSQPDYLRPFAVAKIGSLYYRLDQPGMGKATSETLADNGRTWAASLRMQDDCPGFFIDVHGAPQHMIAVDEFTPADADDTADFAAQVDWKDIACTIFCEFDQHVEAKWPEEDLTTTADVVRTLEIDVPGMRLDYLAADTVVGVDDEGALITTDGGYVRDDRALLSDMARCAFAWYADTRKAMAITKHDLVCEQVIGELITQIGTAENTTTINSVVTKIEFNIREGTTTVHTQFAELDFRNA